LLDGSEGGFELSHQELLGQRDEGTRQLSDRHTQARIGNGESPSVTTSSILLTTNCRSTGSVKMSATLAVNCTSGIAV